MTIVVYQKPTCTTCRQVHAMLKDSGVDFDAVNYYVDPIPKSKLLELLTKMRITPRELLRTKETIYKTLKLAERDLSDNEIVDLMVKHPDLIQRPIVEKGARAILARPRRPLERDSLRRRATSRATRCERAPDPACAHPASRFSACWSVACRDRMPELQPPSPFPPTRRAPG